VKRLLLGARTISRRLSDLSPVVLAVLFAIKFAVSGRDHRYRRQHQDAERRDLRPNDLTKIGTGTLTLTASNLYTGPTNINAGTRRWTARIASSSLTSVASGAPPPAPPARAAGDRPARATG